MSVLGLIYRLLPPSVWLNVSLIPQQMREEPELVLTVADDGQLLSLGFFEHGQPFGWQLMLEHGRAQGRVEIAQGSGGTPDYEVYRNGKAERFDAWSDNERGTPVDYRTWVVYWIRQIGIHWLGPKVMGES
jgi:hypothetical protein